MRVATPRINWSKGVMSREGAWRFDLEPYYQCALDATNAVPIPLGGFDQRGGLRTIARVRRMLLALQINVGMVTAPNGGTPGHLVDQAAETELRTTASASESTPFVVVSIDLGAPRPIALVDARGFSAELGGADDAFGCQASVDGVTWSLIGTPVNIRATARTRRFAAGAGVTAQVRYIRFVVLGQPPIGTIGIKDVRVFLEAPQASPVRKLNFSFRDRESYVMLATDRNIDVFFRGRWVAAIPIPHRADQLEIMTRTQQDDTMLLWHPEVQPHMLFRHGAHDEWDSYSQTFENVPTLPEGVTFGAAQDEVQEIRLTGVMNGDNLQMLVEDCYSSLVAKSADAATMAMQIKSMIEGLPNVDDGIFVQVLEATSSTLVFQVRFAGGANGARSWPTMWVTNHSRVTMGIAVEVIQDGRTSAGEIMSAASGWPRCGCYFQGRLIVGGFKLRPASWAASYVDDFFNFDQPDTLIPNCGFDDTLNSEELPTIHHIYAARHLQFFTETSEWYLSDRALDATSARNVVQATSVGCRPGIEPIRVEGATQFVHGSTDEDTGGLTGVDLRDFLYSDDAEAVGYSADSLTMLAPDLTPNIVDIAYRRAVSPKKPHSVYFANADGAAAMLLFLRREKIQALVPVTTAGKFRCFAADGTRDIFAVVERTAAGVTDHYFEEFDPSCYLDATERITFEEAQTVIPLPARFSGREVWAIADGREYGPYTVTGNQITLPRAVTAVDVGLYFDFRLETMPLRPVLRDGSVDMKPYRIHTLTIAVKGTSSVAVAANGGPPVVVQLRRFGEDLDASPITSPATGEYRVDGLEGKVVGPTAVITRPRPGPVTVEALFMEAA